jgi:nickel-type superoxide dismutase maturation protease
MAHLPLATFVIADTSMQPTLRPGDRVLVSRLGRPRLDDIVVLHDPEAPARFLVKRVVSADSKSVSVRGDSPNVSRDSRGFGSVSRKLVVGRVVYRRLRA